MLNKFSRVERHNKWYNSEYSTHIILQCIRIVVLNICLNWHLLIKPQKCCSACRWNHCRLDFLCICQQTSMYLFSIACMGISVSVRPVNQQQRQLAVRFYSKLYSATSRVNVLARRFRLALNRYIIGETANIKVCLYQVMISNSLFEETNKQHIFSKVFYNSLHFKFAVWNVQWNILQWKISPYGKYI